MGFLSAATILLLLLTHGTEALPAWLSVHLILSVPFMIVCMVGLWHMRKWSIVAFTVLAVLHQVVLIAAGTWGVAALVLPAVIVGIGFDNFSKMH